jgi:hypothetical protein
MKLTSPLLTRFNVSIEVVLRRVRLIPLVTKSQFQNPEERIPRKRLSMVTFVYEYDTKESMKRFFKQNTFSINLFSVI